MTKQWSFRLGARTVAAADAIAGRLGCSRTEAIRLAVETYRSRVNTPDALKAERDALLKAREQGS